MQKHKLRTGVVRAAAVGAAALSAALIVGGGVASASVPPDPQGGATPVAPHFYNGNVEGIRDAGSDTTFFMMQRLGDLYTGAGLYGCTTNTTAGQTLFNSGESSTTTNINFFCQSGQNMSTTDVNDNWDRTEVTQGVDLVGSGGGQNQLCKATPTPLPVDFSRSSKPAGTACSDLVQTGYAKDGVDTLTYPVNPTAVGTGVAATAPYSTMNGGVVGPVGNGWLPGDPNNGPYTGTALTTGGITNVGGAASSAYELWCATGRNADHRLGPADESRPEPRDPGRVLSNGASTATITGTFPSTVAIGDAITGPDIPAGTTITGGLGRDDRRCRRTRRPTATDTVRITTASSLAVGAGAPIGIPVRILGVNTNSGTEATWASYANSGVGSTGNCSANMDKNAALDPNPVTAVGDNATAHIALENNSDQVDQFAVTDFPGDTGLPGHRGSDHAVHRVRRCLQHQPVRRGDDHRRRGVLRAEGDAERQAAQYANQAGEHVPDRSHPVQHLPNGHDPGLGRRLPQLGLRREHQLQQGVGQLDGHQLRHRAHQRHRHGLRVPPPHGHHPGSGHRNAG